ncbi:efflux transporter outer membrane subunit [Stenotrophomonas maltophilia]|uniref:efflux transporter outer membrane subunit n=1 Tax=Stenotrophomonas maltophilia TaxID=40324 RepID=UPI003B62CE9C|nr:efflux transporter outer membrane subunit [Pseudomonas aeruginosa]HBN8236947.1 efflux transporter outer membrane subunit [Pseudomonas aeruginosa]
MFPKLSGDVPGWLMASVLAAPWLAGCSMAPHYERPPQAVPATFGQLRAAAAATAAEQASPAALTDQEREFLAALAPDGALAPLVARALAHNADYRLAALRVEQARAQYRVEHSARLPTVGIDAQQTRQSFDDPALRERYQQDLSRAGIAISDYELDVLGRLKSLSDVAREHYLASEAGQEAARGALVAEVLRAYALVCAATQAHQRLQAVHADNAALLEIAQGQYDIGLIARDALDRRRAGTEQAQVAALRAGDDAAAARRALQLLTGFDAEVAPGLLAPLAEAPDAMAALRDLDSKVLLQRPDIRQAEAELRAANANIGAARAAFFPSIRLSTSLGSASNSLDDLFSSGSRSWSFMPQLVLPIFDFGRNRANLDLAWTRRHAGVIEYERSIEAAFREVADALDARATFAVSEAQLREQDRLAALRLERAERRVSRGLADRQDLLADRIEATRTTLDHLHAQRDLALSRIALFRAFYGVELPARL